MRFLASGARAIAVGRYPLVKTLSFVFRKEQLAPGAKAFVDVVRSKGRMMTLRLDGYLAGP